MRVLVTGGAGFIGTYVVEQLHADGHDTIILDHHADRHPRPDSDLILGDVRDATIVTEAAAHVDGIIHLAAVLGTQETISNPRPSAEVNVLGTLNVFEAATQYDLPVVYAAVGNHWMRNQCAGAYTITKSCGEDLARMYNAHRGARINIVRPCNAYGPRQSVAAPFGWSKVRKITPAFVCRALTGNPIEVYGDGTQISDMIYVTDVAATFCTGLYQGAAGTVWDWAVECGPEKSATVNEIAQLVAELAHDLRPDVGPVPITHLPMRPGEVPNATVSASMATMSFVGIRPERFVPLYLGMRQTVEWFHEHEGVHWWTPPSETAYIFPNGAAASA